MKEKLYKLITEELYEVTCHNYVEDDDDCYHPRGTRTYYFKDVEKANDFHWEYRGDSIKRHGWNYISNASSPYKKTREKYIEVSEEEIRKMLSEQ